MFILEHVAKMQHQAAYWDVFQKATRLKDSGAVTLLRNGYNNIAAMVVGDHGVYHVEIGRDDPNSRTITTWTCECPWDAYAWGRTRQWKKYEGRVCSHVLAAFWVAISTPLDDDWDEENEPAGQSQKRKEEPSKPKVPKPTDQEQQEIGEGWMRPDSTPWLNEQGQLFREKDFKERQKLRDKLKQFDTIPEKPELPFDEPEVKIKGTEEYQGPQQLKLVWDDEKPKPDKKGPNPYNFPGAYSHFVVIAANQKNDVEIIKDMLYPPNGGRRQTPVVEALDEIWGEMRGGKIPHPGAEPVGTQDDGNPIYNWHDLGYNPDLGALHDPRKDGPEERGRWGRIPKGGRCEVADYDQSTGYIYILYSTNLGPLHHHLIQAWVDASEVKLIGNQRVTPFVRRRGAALTEI